MHLLFAIFSNYPCTYFSLHVCFCPCNFALEFTITCLLLQDFACNLLVVNYYSKILLAIYPWLIIIAKFCSQSIRSPLLLQNFACNWSLAKYYCRTLYNWFLIIKQSTLGQLLLHDCYLAILQTNLGQFAIAPSVPDWSTIYLSFPASWLFSVSTKHSPPY